MTTRPLARAVAVAAALVATAAAGVGAQPAPRERTRDAGPLLAPARLAALPAAERAAWERYLATSRELRDLDRAAMRRELDSLGRARMDTAPHHAGFFVRDSMRGAWLASEAGRRLTANLLTWQTPSGGWSKRVDMLSAPRRPGTAYGAEGDGWAYVPTIDNGATTEQLTYLARALAAGAAGARERDAYARGVRYLVRAQTPAGCWPQVFPLQGSYHDAATFNDDATVNVLRVLRTAADSLPVLPDAVRGEAAAAARRGVECLLRAQVREGGTLTAWGQQHDPLTLEPIGARSYEHASLASKESAGVVDYLVTIPDPDARVAAAVHAAADWFRRTAIMGYEYDYRAGLTAKPGAGPLWARMYELGTGRPLFSNRDGVRRYDWNELTDRRQGYAWYTDEPRSTLRRYERWARRHPRPGGERVTKDPAPAAPAAPAAHR